MPLSRTARANARPFPIGSLLALTTPFAEGLRCQRFGRSLQDFGSLAAAGAVLKQNENPRCFPGVSPTFSPTREMREVTDADLKRIEAAEENLPEA